MRTVTMLGVTNGLEAIRRFEKDHDDEVVVGTVPIYREGRGSRGVLLTVVRRPRREVRA